MKVIEAINILEPLNATLDAIKTAYRTFTKKYHPDINPDGLEMMKLGNIAYDMLMKNLEYLEREFCTLNDQAHEYENIAVEIQKIFSKIRHFENIKAEVCGTWLWVSGNTKAYKEQFKEYGFQWASKKKKWSWHPDTYTKRNRAGEWDMAKIRTAWGSIDMETQELKKVV